MKEILSLTPKKIEMVLDLIKFIITLKVKNFPVMRGKHWE